MAEIHGLAARIALLLVFLTTAWSAVLLVTRRPVQPILVGGLVWVAILLGASGLLGILSALTVAPPSDALHVVYGVLAIAVLPGAWAIARAGARDDARRTVVVLVVASVVQLILVFRLFQTGG